MLTVGEFDAAAGRHLRRALVVVWALTPFSVAGALAFHRPDAVSDWFRGRARPATPLWSVRAAAVGGPLALVTAVGWWFHARARRDRRLVCPRCDTFLARSRRSRHRTVATRACHACRHAILADPAPLSPAILAPAAVEAAVARRRRVRRWLVLAAVTSPFVMFGGVIGAALLARAIDERLVSYGVVSFLSALTLLTVWSHVRLRAWARTGFECPRCGLSQPPEWALEFGGCGRCSQPLIAPPAGGVAAGAPPE